MTELPILLGFIITIALERPCVRVARKIVKALS